MLRNKVQTHESNNNYRISIDVKRFIMFIALYFNGFMLKVGLLYSSISPSPIQDLHPFSHLTTPETPHSELMKMEHLSVVAHTNY